MQISSLLLRACAAAAIGVAVGSCQNIDNHRLPVTSANLVFQTEDIWHTHGVSGAGQSKRFIIEKRIPSDFFYTASSSTGFGGILLCTNYLGEVIAYDLACPVECRADVRVFVNEDHLAECERCHSTYNIFEWAGAANSGEAREKGYGLQRYNVLTNVAGAYKVIR